MSKSGDGISVRRTMQPRRGKVRLGGVRHTSPKKTGLLFRGSQPDSPIMPPDRVGSDHEVFAISRDGSGRVKMFSNLAGRDGSP